MNSNPKVYELYKTLRNKIRLTSLEDCMYVLWAYSQNLQFEQSIPPDIELHPQYLSTNFAARGLYPWDLELIAKECIINSSYNSFSDRINESFKKIAFFSKIINQLRALDNVIANEYLSTDNILIEFSRIAYRQFLWQKLDMPSYLVRYYKIFSSKEVNLIVKEKTGLETIEVLRIGMLLYSYYLKHPAIKIPINVDVPEFSSDKIKLFLDRFATPLTTLRSIAENEQHLDDQFFYCGVALRFYPLIEMQYRGQLCVVCPLPTLFFWRITSGLFYEIFEHKDFGKPFGKSFENYVGDVFKKTLTTDSLKAIEEVKYKVKKDEKDTVDWILCDSNAAIFIECKTKKMRNASKTQINDHNVIESDIDILANAIIQCYRSIADYQNNLYPNLAYNSTRTIYPLIVTLEDWYVFDPRYQDLLRRKIQEGLRTKNLPTTIISEMPYSFCPIDEFEGMIQVIEKVGIKAFFEPKVREQEKSGYAFATYYGERFPKETQAIVTRIFDEEYHSIFQKPSREN